MGGGLVRRFSNPGRTLVQDLRQLDHAFFMVMEPSYFQVKEVPPSMIMVSVWGTVVSTEEGARAETMIGRTAWNAVDRSISLFKRDVLGTHQ